MEQALTDGHNVSREMPERHFTIGDMARAYRVTPRALRFYEDRGLIRPIRHGVSRFYDAPARAQLETILRGKKLGFTLTQILTMISNDEEAAAAPRLDLKETQILAQITQLERKREELDAAIVELRDTHRKMTGTPAQTASAA